MTYKRIFTILFTGLISICSLIAQEVQRPARMGNCQNDIPRERYGDGTGVLRAFPRV